MAEVNSFAQGIKEFLETYTPLAGGVYVEFVGDTPTEYAVVMLPEL